MDKIIWDESFSVGVDELDEQHKKLIKMINQLSGIEDISVNSEIISDTLSEMIKYWDYHFKTEEKYLVDADYPDYYLHRKQHEVFMEQTLEFCQNAMDHKESTPVEIHSFLMEWLINHILKSDMQFKSHLSNQGFK